MNPMPQSLRIHGENLNKIEYILPDNLLSNGDWQIGFNSVIFKAKKELKTCVPIKFECDLVRQNVLDDSGVNLVPCTLFQCVIEKQPQNNCQFIENTNLIWLKITNPNSKIKIELRNVFTDKLIDAESGSISIIVNIQRYQ